MRLSGLLPVGLETTWCPADGAVGVGSGLLRAGRRLAPHCWKAPGVRPDPSWEEKGSPVYTAENTSAGRLPSSSPGGETGKLKWRVMGWRWEMWVLGAWRGGFLRG